MIKFILSAGNSTLADKGLHLITSGLLLLTACFLPPSKLVAQTVLAPEALQRLSDQPTQYIFDESLQPDGTVIPFPVIMTENEIADRVQRNAWARAQHGILSVEKLSEEDFGKQLSGEGVLVGVWDGGLIQGAHRQIEGRIQFGEFYDVDVLGTVNTYSRHATHVAGTIAAGDVNSPETKGIAISTQIVNFDFGNNLVEIAAALQGDMQISNHSYGPVFGWRFLNPKQYPDAAVPCNSMLWVGDPDELVDRRFGRYLANSREIDRILYQNPDHLAVVAAGNEAGIVDDPAAVFRALVENNVLPSTPNGEWDGTHCAFETIDGERSVVITTKIRPRDGGPERLDLIGGMGVAKNVLTVGAAIDLETDFESLDIAVTGFSSTGPVDDGRIKPDVIANGELLKSLGVPETCLAESGCIANDLSEDEQRLTRTESGTSMASPVASGIAALLAEFAQWDNVLDRSLLASELKAVIIYGVDSPTGDGAPTYRYGWGMIDALESYGVLDPNGVDSSLTSMDVAPGKTDILLATVTLDDPNRGLRTTVVWTDQAGQIISDDAPNNLRTPALVNDIDTVLISPSGKIFFPWSLNPDAAEARATRTGKNWVDNVEVIDVPKEAFELGEWRLLGSAAANNTGPVGLAIVVGHVAR